MLSERRRTLALLLAVIAFALLGGGVYYYYFIGLGKDAREAGEGPGPTPARTFVGPGVNTTQLGTTWPDTSVCFKWPQYMRAVIDKGCAGQDPTIIGGGGFRCVNPARTLWSSCQYNEKT